MITRSNSTLKIRQQADLFLVRHGYAMLHNMVIRLEQGLPGVAPIGRKVCH